MHTIFSTKENLQNQTNIEILSIGDLTVDVRYPVIRFERRETENGLKTKCILETNRDDGNAIAVFLPECIKISDDEIQNFNDQPQKDLYLIYQGKQRNSFKLKFE